METETFRSRIGSALSNRDYADVETAWREYASSHPEDYEYLLTVAQQLSRFEKGALAGELCMALSETLLEKGETQAAFDVARASLKASQKTEGLRELLMLVYKAQFTQNLDLDLFMEKSGLSSDTGSLRQQIDTLDRLLTFEEGAYVFHRGGWGYGEVAEFEADEESMVVDFQHRKGHRIGVRSATKILERLPADHVGVYKHYRRAELDTLIKDAPAQVFHLFLRGNAGKATLKQVREELVPDVLDKAEWSRWWGRAKKALLKDPQISIGKGSSPLLELRDEAKSIETEVAEKMRARTSGIERCAVAREYLRTLDLTPELADAIRGELVSTLADEELSPSARLALLYLQSDLGGEDGSLAAGQAGDVLNSAEDLVALLSPLEPADRKRAVQDLAKAGTPGWAEKIAALLDSGDADVADGAMEVLKKKRPDMLVRFFAELTTRPSRNPTLFLWFVRGFVSGAIPADLAPGEKKQHVIERVLTMANQMGTEVLRTGDAQAKEFMRLARNFLTGRRLATFKEFVAGSSLDYGRFLHAKVLRNRGFTDQTKQALLDVIESEHPNIHESDATEAKSAMSASTDMVYTTLAGYHRQETELRQVIEVEIPEIAKELGRAASFGDISENAEYSAALDKQERIMRRLGELRDALDRARILEPDEVTTDRVVIGTRVRVLNQRSGNEESFTLLGPWDVNLEKGIISYMSPVGRGLLGKKPDEEAKIELPEAGSVDYKVLGIELAPNLMADEEE